MKKIKMIAHHSIGNDEKLNDIEITKERLSDMLEFAIREIVSDRGMYQECFGIDTYPDEC